MGTNYYLKQEKCPTCGRGEDLHIGKSSVGWCFSLHVYPHLGINDLGDWESKWSEPKSEIYDEYGKAVDASEMLLTITKRSSKGKWTVEQLRQNQAVAGPNGLARDRSARPGDGTYDLHEGDFS